jgi:hypothetical protein
MHENRGCSGAVEGSHDLLGNDRTLTDTAYHQPSFAIGNLLNGLNKVFIYKGFEVADGTSLQLNGLQCYRYDDTTLHDERKPTAIHGKHKETGPCPMAKKHASDSENIIILNEWTGGYKIR